MNEFQQAHTKYVKYIFYALCVAIVFVIASSSYIVIANKNCSEKAGAALGITGKRIDLLSRNGESIAMSYDTYHKMCMNKSYGLN